MPRRSTGSDLAEDRARQRPESRRLAQARHVRRRLRLNSQPDRLDPQSQSLSRSYGSNLPISLTYIHPSTRGCSPRRPDADIGTSRRERPTT